MLNIAMWITSLATCAIEGNRWAAETLELRKTNPNEFLRRIAQLERHSVQATAIGFKALEKFVTFDELEVALGLDERGQHDTGK